MTDERGNPDELLRKIKEEEEQRNRGHLKIFFGYAAGVGKTYGMLKAGHAAKHRGVDVVAGYVEPHSRPQTSQMMNGLEVIPPLKVQHKGIELNEFDLDATLERKPQLVLVDELAHSNGPGCRHEKRYQDIVELLNAGISVYSTVNVQHIESLNDIVESITGVLVRERVPDQFFDNVDQVELVDIEPEELIERLNAGKIYKGPQAQKALQHFFSTENLIALREIALRRCADRMNKISEKVRVAQGAQYFTDEHILVCLSSSPTNTKIIRTAARMADAFRGSFTAIFVETRDFDGTSEENKKRLRANMHLAEQLGATIETVHGDDPAFQIAEFARLSGVSKVVLGRSSVRRRRWLGKPPLAERLTVTAPNLDVYIIPDKDTPSYKVGRAKDPAFQFSLMDFLRSVGLLAAATLIGFLFYDLGFSESNIIIVYILGILINGVVTSHRMYSLVASIVSVLVFNYFFTVPRFSLEAYDKGYPATFLIMFISAFITGSLAVRIKQHARVSTAVAYRTKILFDTNQMLQKEKGKEGIVQVTAKQMMRLLNRSIIFYGTKGDMLEKPIIFSQEDERETAAYITENEKAVAAWVYKNNKRAGATTATLGNARCLYLAVRVNDSVYGVVGIAMEEQPLDSFENSIVLSILGECALALENQKVSKEREEAAVLAKNEQLRANLLRAISHDLRTPLTSISGNAGILLSSDGAIDAPKRKQLYTDIYDDSLWLINLVENLLSVTKIEEGSMHLRMTSELMEEVIEEAMRHINRRSTNHQIIVEQSADFLMAKIDARLIVQVLINLVDNAIKYTPEGSEIYIRTQKRDNNVVVEVADNGNGIDDESKKKIFDMFYTVGTTKIADNRRSLGLGLALCKSIVNVHGGEISVRDNSPQGTVFCFTLPAEEVTVHE